MSDFNRGDLVLLDGQQVTITGFPEDNVGYFTYEYPLPGGGKATGTRYYGYQDGEPIGPSAVLTLVKAAEPQPAPTYEPVADPDAAAAATPIADEAQAAAEATLNASVTTETVAAASDTQ